MMDQLQIMACNLPRVQSKSRAACLKVGREIKLEGDSCCPLRGPRTAYQRPCHDRCRGVLAATFSDATGGESVVPSRPRVAAAGSLPLAGRQTTGHAGTRDRAWTGRLERFELCAGHRGKSVSSRLPRSANESAKLRRHGDADSDAIQLGHERGLPRSF